MTGRTRQSAPGARSLLAGARTVFAAPAERPAMERAGRRDETGTRERRPGAGATGRHDGTGRRAVLAGAGSLGTALLAGCLAGGPGGTDAPSPTATDTDDWRDRASFDDVDREVYVAAERYRFTPGTDDPIRVGHGERVGLAVTALDQGYHSGHGVYVPADAYDVDLQAAPGGTSSTTFRADVAGEFEVRCDVYCGEGHDDMTGRLVVE